MLAREILKPAKICGYSENNGLGKLGFVIEDLSNGQIPYFCINNANVFLNQSIGIDISIFYENNAFPCVFPRFARYHVTEIVGFTGKLIGTSFKSMLSSLSGHRCDKFFYINELEWEKLNFPYSKEDFQRVMFNDKIVKFTRCKDYFERLTKCGVSVSPIIVEDFNIGKILEVINASSDKK